MHVQFSNQIPGKHPEYVLRSTEPSIEWEDPLPPQNLRLENMRSRSLHTFVPLPPSSASPTLVTHGGIPSHMVENPEPNLRPTTLRPPTHMERDHPSTNPVGIHSPVLMSDPNPNPGNPSSITPGREISRNTIPVPVRSKQRVASTIDPQPKKRQLDDGWPESVEEQGLLLLVWRRNIRNDI